MAEEHHFKTIAEVAPLIRDRRLTATDLLESQIERIERLDGGLKAYATVMSRHAREQARAADVEIGAGRYRGALHGVPVAVKDLCDTAGVRTMGGCAVLADHVPAFDATVVAKLAEAGAVLLGKLNLTEGAMGGYNPKFDVPENPWKKGHYAGASSSGSGCATAAGLAFATLGSDTGGSIRTPASACGTVGLKPTWGRVSRYGVLALAESLDHVGPLTRSSADAGIVLQAISGSDPNDPTALPESVPDMLGSLDAGVRGLKVGYDETYAAEDMEADFAAAVAAGVRTVERLGAQIVPVTMPSNLREYMGAWPVLCASEAAAAHAQTFPSRAGEYGPWLRQWLESGVGYSATEYAEANVLRAACVGELRQIMRDIDVMAGPSTARSAYPVTPDELYGPMPAEWDPWRLRFSAPTNYSGLPTISLPCGLNGDGLPLSIQFVGHLLAEPLLVGLGHAFEQATEFHELHPPV